MSLKLKTKNNLQKKNVNQYIIQNGQPEFKKEEINNEVEKSGERFLEFANLNQKIINH